MEEMIRVSTEIKLKDREKVCKEFMTERIMERDEILERVVNMNVKDFKKSFKIV